MKTIDKVVIGVLVLGAIAGGVYVARSKGSSPAGITPPVVAQPVQAQPVTPPATVYLPGALGGMLGQFGSGGGVSAGKTAGSGVTVRDVADLVKAGTGALSVIGSWVN